MSPLAAAFTLLVIYQAKHFLADYPLQGPYMLGKFKPGWGFLGPLSAHAAVHALFTFFIAFWWTFRPGAPDLAFPGALALLDFVVHFTMDRIKAGPKYLGRFKALSPAEYKLSTLYVNDCIGAVREGAQAALRGNTYFWWALGFDQMVHHLTHYAIIYLLVTA